MYTGASSSGRKSNHYAEAPVGSFMMGTNRNNNDPGNRNNNLGFRLVRRPGSPAVRMDF
jgi:formylglycine-generating enzyme required for sulfatase activity